MSSSDLLEDPVSEGRENYLSQLNAQADQIKGLMAALTTTAPAPAPAPADDEELYVNLGALSIQAQGRQNKSCSRHCNERCGLVFLSKDRGENRSPKENIKSCIIAVLVPAGQRWSRVKPGRTRVGEMGFYLLWVLCV